MVFDDGIETRSETTVIIQVLRRETDVGDACVRVLLFKDDETVAMLVRQRPKQHAVNRAEDRGVSTDAERQNGYRGDREAGPAGLSHAETDILPESFQPPCPPGVAAGFLDLLDAAEISGCRQSRRLGAHAVADVLGDLHLHVETHLFVQVPFEGGPLDQRTQ